MFTEGGKPENPEKNSRSKGENQQQTQLTYDTKCLRRRPFLTLSVLTSVNELTCMLSDIFKNLEGIIITIRKKRMLEETSFKT
jgi:hypothetical protein